MDAARDRAGLRDWPQNAARHSFASYHLAQHQDAAKLALEMGNSPAMVFGHYRELVKTKDAEKFWSIRPSKAAQKKVMAMVAKAALNALKCGRRLVQVTKDFRIPNHLRLTTIKARFAPDPRLHCYGNPDAQFGRVFEHPLLA